jgi:hypothetical protein
VQTDCVYHLAPLLKLAFGALHELGVDAHGIVVSRSCVGAAEFRDLARGLVDGDDVARHDLFFGHGIDHLGAHVVDGLHVGGFDGKLALLVALHTLSCSPSSMVSCTYPCDAAVDLDLDHLALDDLALFGYPHANRLAESLCERLRLGHLQREYLGRGEHGEGHVGAQRLGHAHCDGRLSCAWWPSNQDGAPSDLAFLCHSEDDCGSFARLFLSNETLRRGFWLERVWLNAQTANVRVRRDEIEAAELFALGDGGDGLRSISRDTQCRGGSPTTAIMATIARDVCGVRGRCCAPFATCHDASSHF